MRLLIITLLTLATSVPIFGQTTFTAGICDNFALPLEASEPDSLFNAWFTSCRTKTNVGFDAIPGENAPANSVVHHTFDNLPGNITSAVLKITLKATTAGGAGGLNTDHITIENFLQVDSCLRSIFWQRTIRSLPEAGGSWSPGEVATFTLDLANLPLDPIRNISNILPDISGNRLRIRIDDDTGADCMELTITSGADDDSSSDDSSSDDSSSDDSSSDDSSSDDSSSDDSSSDDSSSDDSSHHSLKNLPNPFMDITTFRFTAESAGQASLLVYNLEGKVVSWVFNKQVEAGKQYQAEFDGSGLPNGIYISKLTIGEDVIQHKKLILYR